VTHADHPERRTPRRHSHAARPASTRPAGRRVGDRRPYPTAPTTTRVSPAKPSPRGTRGRCRRSAVAPTPATVWTCGPTPIDPEATWPPPLITKIVNSFSKPHDHVVVLPWPNGRQQTTVASVRPTRMIDDPNPTAPDTVIHDDPTAAADLIARLDRTAQVLHLRAASPATGTTSQPFWSNLVSDADGPAAALPAPPPDHVGAVLNQVDAEAASADLVLTSLHPEHCGDHTSDLVTLMAARLLRVGGILTVLTHCDWSRGELVDPTGHIVAAGQHADLLHLQHIVALHTPVRHGQLTAALDGRAAETAARSWHRAAVRGLPPPHRRVHSDLLVFAQPHQHDPLPPDPGGAASQAGASR
jgi:hypothetical protein